MDCIFTYFSCLIALARTEQLFCSIVLNRSSESRHLCLPPYLRGNTFSLSSLSITFVVDFSCMAFIRVILLSPLSSS